ncbi:acyl dehydratase [Propionicimonas paludicola]|uniref:Acyl dehydratase n=1 Tax=Propionicimonas paludicola TaxID=185243 RepID=A0A2A9CRP0_9ACTN|nr:MaoC family dehydratase N-terminal domain-containing protein [Propionicimonas paludicola]PFG17038.1 acyl dehydratase [Propionicimonas paludicola]
MPISEAHVGRSYPATSPYEVTGPKIAEFATALGEPDNPAYHGTDAIAPPTFAVVLAGAAWSSLFADPELELSLARTVHVDQGFRWSRPLRRGDQVTAQLTIEKVRVRGSAAFITIAVALATTAGEPVAVASSTLLHQGEAQ